jgi:hypothetical protein
MKSQLNEVQKLQKIAGLLKENMNDDYQENKIMDEAKADPELLAAVIKLYQQINKPKYLYKINSDDVDQAADSIAEKFGSIDKRTPGGLLDFRQLNNNQLKAIVPFFQAVLKKGSFDAWYGDAWDGKNIIDIKPDEEDEED